MSEDPKMPPLETHEERQARWKRQENPWDLIAALEHDNARLQVMAEADNFEIGRLQKEIKEMTSRLEDSTGKKEPNPTTTIHECDCENDRWDIHYGKGLRPHTSGRAVNKGTIVCMNCLREKFPNKEQ